VATLQVADLGSSWDALCGEPWLRQHQVILNFCSPPRAAVRKDKRFLILQCESDDSVHGATDQSAADCKRMRTPLLSALPMRRVIDKGVMKMCYTSVLQVAPAQMCSLLMT
jgi:hypothetical protein